MITIKVNYLLLSSLFTLSKANPQTLHDEEAPTRQNSQCQMKSVWEVIREHDDYKFANTPYPGARSMNRYVYTDTTHRRYVYSLQLSDLGTRLSEQIQFDTVRQNNKRIVLCIDYSTSMNEVVGATTKYRQVIQAATQYVKGLSINTHIALVGFSRKPQDWIIGSLCLRCEPSITSVMFIYSTLSYRIIFLARQYNQSK